MAVYCMYKNDFIDMIIQLFYWISGIVLTWISGYGTRIELVVLISVRLSLSLFLPLLFAIDCFFIIVSFRSNEETAISCTKASRSVTSALSTSEGFFHFILFFLFSFFYAVKKLLRISVHSSITVSPLDLLDF